MFRASPILTHPITAIVAGVSLASSLVSQTFAPSLSRTVKEEVLERVSDMMNVTQVENVCRTGSSGYVVEIRDQAPIDPRTGATVDEPRTLRVYGVVKGAASKSASECPI